MWGNVFLTSAAPRLFLLLVQRGGRSGPDRDGNGPQPGGVRRGQGSRTTGWETAPHNTASCLCHSYFHKTLLVCPFLRREGISRSERAALHSQQLGHYSLLKTRSQTILPTLITVSVSPPRIRGLGDVPSEPTNKLVHWSGACARVCLVVPSWLKAPGLPTTGKHPGKCSWIHHTLSMLPGFTLSLHFHKRSSVMRKLSCLPTVNISATAQSGLIWFEVSFRRNPPFFFFR